MRYVCSRISTLGHPDGRLRLSRFQASQEQKSALFDGAGPRADDNCGELLLGEAVSPRGTLESACVSKGTCRPQLDTSRLSSSTCWLRSPALRPAYAPPRSNPAAPSAAEDSGQQWSEHMHASSSAWLASGGWSSWTNTCSAWEVERLDEASSKP
eukprot:scaffold1282_cov251-Pinguiococcus_pyrenoidosus.AAC.76